MPSKKEQFAPPAGPPPSYPQQPQQAYQGGNTNPDLNYSAASGPDGHQDRGMFSGGRPQQGYYGGQPGYGYGQPQPGMYYQQPYGPPNGGYYADQRGPNTAAEGCCMGMMGALCCLDLCLIF